MCSLNRGIDLSVAAAAQAGGDGDGGGLLVAALGGAARRRNGEGEVRRDGRHQEELCKETSSL